MNDNETVDNVYESILNDVDILFKLGDRHHAADVKTYASKLMEAHRREIAAKDEEIARLERMKDDYLNMQKNMKNLRAEITLKQNQICNNNQFYNTKIRELRTLVKELADALEKLESIGVDCSCCGIPCDRLDRHEGCIVDGIGELVAKARETCE